MLLQVRLFHSRSFVSDILISMVFQKGKIWATIVNPYNFTSKPNEVCIIRLSVHPT